MTTTATPETLQAMLLQIVKDTGYEIGLRLNTFATIDKLPDLRSPAFGKTHQDYERGNFWARDWFHGGADSAQVKGEFPALFMEWREIQMDSPAAEEGYTPVNLYLVDKIDCPECPDAEIRTPEYLTRTTMRTMRMVLQELSQFWLWEVDTDPVTYKWASEGRAQYEQAQAGAPEQTPITDIGAHLDASEVRITQYTNLPDLRVAFTTLKWWWCDPIGSNFLYKDDIVKTLAYTKCPC